MSCVLVLCERNRVGVRIFTKICRWLTFFFNLAFINNPYRTVYDLWHPLSVTYKTQTKKNRRVNPYLEMSFTVGRIFFKKWNITCMWKSSLEVKKVVLFRLFLNWPHFFSNYLPSKRFVARPWATGGYPITKEEIYTLLNFPVYFHSCSTRTKKLRAKSIL